MMSKNYSTITQYFSTKFTTIIYELNIFLKAETIVLLIYDITNTHF